MASTAAQDLPIPLMTTQLCALIKLIQNKMVKHFHTLTDVIQLIQIISANYISSYMKIKTCNILDKGLESL